MVGRLWGWFTAVDVDRSGHISAYELREYRHLSHKRIYAYWFS